MSTDDPVELAIRVRRAQRFLDFWFVDRLRRIARGREMSADLCRDVRKAAIAALEGDGQALEGIEVVALPHTRVPHAIDVRAVDKSRIPTEEGDAALAGRSSPTCPLIEHGRNANQRNPQQCNNYFGALRNSSQATIYALIEH